MELNKIYHVDSREGYALLDDLSIDMIVTSPPYWSLRDYDVNNQIGLEETPEDFVNGLVNVFGNLKPKLKNEGTLWVNLGDTYLNKNIGTMKKKSLAAIPERFKIAMIDNGWVCRNEIIWHKPNAMPSSAKDRFNADFEKIFFFTKNDDYYFETQYDEAKTKPSSPKKKKEINITDTKYLSLEQEKLVRQGMSKDRGSNLVEKRNLPTQEEFVNTLRSHFTINEIVERTGLKKTLVEHWFRRDKKGFAFPKKEDWELMNVDLFPELLEVYYETDDINKNLERGKLKRCVWSINTKPFKGTHFAIYPEKLIETPILAGSPLGGVVLDPFIGSGTTGVVAKRLGRNYMGFDLNSEYIKVAEKRIENSIKNELIECNYK